MSNETKKLEGMITHYVDDNHKKRSLSSLNGKQGLFEVKPWIYMDTKEKREYLVKHNPEFSKEEIEELVKYGFISHHI